MDVHFGRVDDGGFRGAGFERGLGEGRLGPTNRVFFSISKKKKDILTRNGPLSDSLRCRSTALCVARLSAVFALLLVLRLICWAVLVPVGAAGWVGCC